jgi:hypothetical protein
LPCTCVGGRAWQAGPPHPRGRPVPETGAHVAATRSISVRHTQTSQPYVAAHVMRHCLAGQGSCLHESLCAGAASTAAQRGLGQGQAQPQWRSRSVQRPLPLGSAHPTDGGSCAERRAVPNRHGPATNMPFKKKPKCVPERVCAQRCNKGMWREHLARTALDTHPTQPRSSLATALKARRSRQSASLDRDGTSKVGRREGTQVGTHELLRNSVLAPASCAL